MFDTNYKIRVRNKFLKYSAKSNCFLALIKITGFIGRDIANAILLAIPRHSHPTHSKLKDILFLEPFKQGYGDLLFQTSVFESLKAQGYRVSVVIQQNHLPIIENSPCINEIFFWNDPKTLLKLPFKQFTHIAFLGRDTIRETLFGLAFVKAQKIILDENLSKWIDLFSQNHSRAWLELLKTYFDQNLNWKEPKIYLGPTSPTPTPESIRVAIIVGVNSEEKRLKNMPQILHGLRNTENVRYILVGASDSIYASHFNEFNEPQFSNLINKLDYRETINLLAEIDAVIGTEGSLVHVGLAFHKPTIVLDNQGIFWRQSWLQSDEIVRVLTQDFSANRIKAELSSLI